jgi:purine-binding chemotaxis protein CheW
MHHTVWVAFRIGSITLALPRERISRILAIPALGHPPGLPSAMEGILDLAGRAIPVIRLDRLLGLPPISNHPYRHILLLHDVDPAVALLVDRTTDILRVSSDAEKALPPDETFNGCVIALYSAPDSTQVHLLSSDRLLNEREKRALVDFQATEQRRLAEFRSSI